MTPPEICWTLRACEDLLGIYVLIGLDQPAAAERYYERISGKVQMLASQPRMGVRRPEIRPALRMLVEQPYLILYHTAPDTDEGPVEKVEIVRIVDGRRDLASMFL